MCTTIKTNLNSDSNGCSLAALKKHISTCLIRWQQKFLIKNKEKRNDLTLQEENSCCQFRKNSSIRFIEQFYKQNSLAQNTAIYYKTLNTKLKNIFQKHCFDNTKPTTFNDREYGRRIEFIAKLLSSTLIAKGVTLKEDKGFKKKTEVVEKSTPVSEPDFYKDKMTIMQLTFLEVREENPDLDTEIRSILTAHSQEGATISQIRDEYHKLTGLRFPVYEDITEFLLTIPHVTAHCSEKGTRIFNIKPMDKTKHIHDMVMNQKPSLEKLTNHCYYRERIRNPNYQPVYRLQSTNYSLPQNIENVGKPAKIIQSTDSNLAGDGLKKGCAENNCYYQDNCNYIFNRIYNQTPQEAAYFIEKAIKTKADAIYRSNNFNNVDTPSYKNKIKPFNKLFQGHLYQRQQHRQNLSNSRNIATRSSIRNCKMGNGSSSSNAKIWNTNELVYTDSDYQAHLLDFLLLGDDFFLYMARMELRCKFKKNERILQSGLCVSGQTISASIKRIRAISDQHRSIILNIGSVDIMQGKQLIQIEHEFRELIAAMLKKDIKPILTTLAPLANYSHNREVKRTLERFNDFIKREAQKRKLIVIDIWKCLVNDKGCVFFDCYQNEPRTVSGAFESYLFWNKIGRQRVLQLIESNLEY